tara:strand:- start:213 stop:632 length:420 start_codon:yes stop_codon:yes gene_type:complete
MIPDTLLIVLVSMIYLIFLTCLPYYIWISDGGITLHNLLYGRHTLQDLPIKVRVANLALLNYKETFPIFLGLSILGIVMGIPIQIACLIWLILRFIHTPSYIFAWNWIRTLSWQASIICLFWMMFQIISLNRLTMFSEF